MALINTTTTGVLGTTVFGDGSGDLTVQQNGVTVNKITSQPVFSAYSGSTQSVSTSTNTKVNIDTEEFDTANCFDTANKRFTPTIAGYYQFNFQVSFRSATNVVRFACYVYKNGSGSGPSKNGGDINFNTAGNNGYKIGGSGLIYANGTTDYFELYAYVETSAGTNVFNGGTGGTDSFFQGYLVKAA